MYYSFPCPYCSKIFYVFNDSKDAASKALYDGVKKHLADYDEDRKEHQLDDGVSEDSLEIYNGIAESSDIPPGGYPI